MTDAIRKAAEQARRTLKKAFNRIHCLPRTTDTELANEIEKNLAALDAALAADELPPPAPSDADQPKGGDANDAGEPKPQVAGTKSNDTSPGSKCEPAGASDAELVGIWSCEYDAWWRPNACGYTKDSACAGVWSRSEAEKIADAEKEKHLIARTIPIHPDAAAAIERLTRERDEAWGKLDHAVAVGERFRDRLAAEREARLAAVAMRNTAIEQRDLAAIKLKPSEDAAQEAIARAEAAEARVRELEATPRRPQGNINGDDMG